MTWLTRRVGLCALAATMALVTVKDPVVAFSGVPSVMIPQPATNLPGGGWVTDGSRIIYVVDDPPVHPRPTLGQKPFVGFAPRFYVVQLTSSTTGLHASAPRLLFSEQRGLGIEVRSLVNGWLTYERSTGWFDTFGLWTMVARNIFSGQQIILDTRDQEGVSSISFAPATDGTSVVWTSLTRHPGSPVSVLRIYNLRSGHKSVLLSSRPGSPWFYIWARVSGTRVVFEQDNVRTGKSQILLYDLRSRTVRGLTPATEVASEPSISGDLLTWKAGFRGGSSARAIMIMDVRAGKTTKVPVYNPEQPQALANRYVIVAGQSSQVRIQIYDTKMLKKTAIFVPHDGYGAGNAVAAGGHVVLYSIGKLCGDPNYMCPGKLVAARLP